MQDVLPQLMPQLPPGLAHTPLPLPAAVASTHRVQVAIRGRRYETAMDVALTYCLALFVFFRWPFALSISAETRETGDCTVGDAVLAAPDTAAEEVTEAALLEHYTRVVEPVLQTFVEQCAAPSAERLEEKNAAAAALALLPALPRPVRISHDHTTHTWKFEYAARLSPAEEAAERARRGAGATAEELNGSPYLLLQCEYMGVLLVYLRRCAKVHAEQHATAAPYPALPIRWAEMSFDEQASFVMLLRALGVVSLAGVYACPTAAPSTSLYIGAGSAAAAAAARAEGDACSLLRRAAEFAQLQPQPQQRCAPPQTPPAPPRTTRQAEAGDMDGLELPAKGCARCGMAGHATAECRY